MPARPTLDIPVGQRFPYDLFDEQGELLLLRGQPVTSPLQATDLKRHGHRSGAQARTPGAFSAMQPFADRMSLLEEAVQAGESAGNWVKRFTHLTQDFLEIVDDDPDAAFAAIHLNLRHSYLVCHHLMNAMVCARLALAHGMSRNERFSLVAAALTHDIGLFGMKSLLDCNRPLTDEERHRIQEHAGIGLQQLRAFGVTDPLWLAAVADHHEFLDGSGYQGKTAEELPLASRIMALADAYSAMLRPRPHRDRILARQALESLYANETARYDGYLIESLIWDFGFFPPGSMLRLANRELAVAVRNTPGILDRPWVAALTDAGGHPLLKPALRDTNLPEFAIERTLDPSMASRAGRLLAACWDLPLQA